MFTKISKRKFNKHRAGIVNTGRFQCNARSPLKLREHKLALSGQDYDLHVEMQSDHIGSGNWVDSLLGYYYRGWI